MVARRLVEQFINLRPLFAKRLLLVEMRTKDLDAGASVGRQSIEQLEHLRVGTHHLVSVRAHQPPSKVAL